MRSVIVAVLGDDRERLKERQRRQRRLWLRGLQAADEGGDNSSRRQQMGATVVVAGIGKSGKQQRCYFVGGEEGNSSDVKVARLRGLQATDKGDCSSDRGDDDGSPIAM
ncbi:hypothetical protein BHE74_00057336 [Ensete ventricosum]|nr:hypothetical protein GW17_00040454 [Ensete ventricosum]RWW37536.1 hypothetical protein BHE74_00057336 [Ensete ventricosum]